MMALDAKGVRVKMGDMVDFKSDYEQIGEVVKIEGDRLYLYNADGFGGAYLRYASFTWEDADRCWVIE